MSVSSSSGWSKILTSYTSSRSETPGKFWNVLLQKDGEDQLDRSCEKWRSITWSQSEDEYPTWNKKTVG